MARGAHKHVLLHKDSGFVRLEKDMRLGWQPIHAGASDQDIASLEKVLIAAMPTKGELSSNWKWRQVGDKSVLSAMTLISCSVHVITNRDNIKYSGFRLVEWIKQ